jgi:hypothetical protein
MRIVHGVTIDVFMNKNENLPEFNEEKIKNLKEKKDIQRSFLYPYFIMFIGFVYLNEYMGTFSPESD